MDQFEFDSRDGRILRTIEGANGSRIGLCELARFLGDGKALGALEQLAKTHPHHSVRAAALRSIASIDPSEGELLARKLASGGDDSARRAGMAILERVHT